MCIYWWETTINKRSNKYWSKSDAYKRCAQKWSKRGQEGQQEWAADFMPSGWGRTFWRFLCQRRTEGRRWGDERPRGNRTARISAQREGGQKAAEGQTGRVGRMPWAGLGRTASGSTAAQAACPDTGRRPWGLRRQLIRWWRWHLRGRSGLQSPRPFKGKTQGSSLLASKGHLNSLGKADWGGGKWWQFGYVEFEFPRGGPRGMVYVAIRSSGKTWKWTKESCDHWWPLSAGRYVVTKGRKRGEGD